MIRFLFLYLIILFFSCQPRKHETKISGKIIGDIPESISYSVPVEGGCNLQFLEDINIDSSGNFQLELAIEKPAFIRLISGPKLNNKFIIAEPGKEYEINLDYTNEENIFNVKCESMEAHNFYNNLEMPFHIDVLGRQLAKDTSFTFTRNNILRSQEKEQLALDKLYHAGSISNELYSIIKKDRNIYYKSLIQSVALKRHLDFRNSGETVKADRILKEHDKLFENFDISDVPLNSQWTYNLLNQFIEFKRQWLIYSIPNENPEITKKQGVSQIDYINFAKQFLPQTHIEYYMANRIAVACRRQTSYEPELIELIKYFKTNYPESGYISFLEKAIKPMLDLHERSPLNGVTILKDYPSINSIMECAHLLPEKNIYVDVWATWCKPCIEQFSYNDTLKEILKSKDVVKLYISVDDDEDDEHWRKQISYYNLEGYHLRANKLLNAELENLGINSIPIYFILDKDGKILKMNAAKPSDLEKLEKELTELETFQ